MMKKVKRAYPRRKVKRTSFACQQPRQKVRRTFFARQLAGQAGKLGQKNTTSGAEVRFTWWMDGDLWEWGFR